MGSIYTCISVLNKAFTIQNIEAHTKERWGQCKSTSIIIYSLPTEGGTQHALGGHTAGPIPKQLCLAASRSASAHKVT